MEEIHQKNNAFFRQLIFIVVLAILGLVIFRELRFFLGSFLGAVTIYVVLRGMQFKLTEKYHWKSWLAALLLVIGFSILFGGASFLVFKLIVAEIPNVNASRIIGWGKGMLDKLNQEAGFNFVPMDIIDHSQGLITSLLSSILNTTYSFAANVFMMIVILYFMLSAGRRLETQIFSYSPFQGKSLRLLKREVKNMIFSNAVGMPVIMVAQSIMAYLIYWLMDLHNLFFWSFLTAICGLIPVVGTGIVYVPLGLYMIFSGGIWQGIVVILYGLLVISNTDNVIRIVLLKRGANTHPLIVVFGVILGIPLFGFWGIIFGPLMISGFLLLLRIYYVEYELIPRRRKKSS